MSAATTFRPDLFAGTRVLITGAARGIGACIAEAFADAGAHLALQDVDSGALAATAERLRAKGADISTFASDLTGAGVASGLVEEAAAAIGSLGILVNNAGRSWAVDTPDIDPAKARELVELNQMAPLWLCQSFIAHRCCHGGGGNIVQVSSTAGIVGFGSRAVYAATKHALQGLTRVLAIDHAADGIRVNAILPHVIESSMFHTVARPEEAAAWSAGIPLRRLGTPDDVAGAALFLCSPAASYITGSSILVDGGAMAG